MHELSFVALLGLVTACSTLQGDTAARTLTAASSVPTSFEVRPLASPVVANVPVLPQGLTSFGAVEHEGVLYVLGGYSGMPHAYSAQDQHGELLAYEDGQWSIVSEVPKVQGAALVSHATGLVRVGGMRALNETVATDSELVSVDTVQRFNASDGTWSDLPALPQGRSSHDAVVVGDTLFVVGGWTLDHQPKAGAWSSDMFTLDLSREGAVWKRRATPFSRRALAVASAGGKLFVLGGMDAERRISQSVEVYDPAKDAWTQAADFPGQGFGMAAVGRGSTVHASGADGGIYELDVETNVWQRTSSMVMPRFFHRLVATADGTVWTLGGIRPKQSGARVRLSEPVAGERASEAVTVRVPSMVPSKNRQGAAVLGDGLYLFGGNVSLGQHDFAPDDFTADAVRFDLATLQWTDIADYPMPRQTMSVATHMGDIYAFGGFGHDGEGAKSHPEVFVYSPEDDAWSRAGGTLPMPRGRTQFGLANAEGRWWIFGGLDYDPSRAKGDQFRHEQPILAAPSDLTADFADSGASLTEPRRAFAGARFDGQYVVVGGMKQGFELVDSCAAFEFSTASWAPFPCPSIERLSGSLVPMGDDLAVFAGSSKLADGTLAPDATVEVYEASNDAWRPSPFELPVPPKHLHAFSWNGGALLVSTHNDEDMLDLVVVRPGVL